MPTTLTATYQAGTSTLPPRVLLQVTGAPSLTASYTSNFAASVDGWTGSAGTTLAFNQSPNVALRITGAAGTSSTFSRTVTGLTVGQVYRFSAMVDLVAGASIALGITGKVNSTIGRPASRSAMSVSFTATATSHVITFTVNPGKTPSGGSPISAAFLVDTVVVIRTSGWQGTTIRRTDANGTAVVVRENDGGQDTVGTSGSATMTVTDYEAALVGVVTYSVTDGNGGNSGQIMLPPSSPGAWLTLPATAVPGTPVAPTNVAIDLVTGYTEDSPSNGSAHVIIGRADPILNPGPLALRRGSLSLWCKDYETARQVRTMLSTGAVAMLRQPTFVGLDLYFVAQDLAIEPAEQSEPQRWVVTLAFQEVGAP